MADEMIRGGRELAQVLSTLAPKLEKNIMRAALRAGAAVIREEAKANVPVLEGKLKKSIKVSAKVKAGKIMASVKVGGRLAPHAHLVEFGTRPHKIEPKNAGALSIAGVAYRSVDHPGARPNPFFRPALDAKSGDAVAAVAAKIRERLTKEGINSPAPEEP